MATSKKRALSGIRASGDIHLGNYLGMMKPMLELQHEYQCFFFIADLHSLTTILDGPLIQENVRKVAAAWLALGLDHNQHLFYRQSDVPMVTELMWYLSSVTGVGFLEKSHAYKDALQNGSTANLSLFSYPVLMAADILMYDADIVPVGKDQAQHVEMARDFAGSFNAALGRELLKLPELKVREDVALVPGLDGRKMSKRYDNGLLLFEDDKKTRKRMMGITTDSTPLEAPKSMKGSLLGTLAEHLMSKADRETLEAKLNGGGIGWGHAKEALYESFLSLFQKQRAEYTRIINDHPYIDDILVRGAEKAREIATPILGRIRHAVGMR